MPLSSWEVARYLEDDDRLPTAANSGVPTSSFRERSRAGALAIRGTLATVAAMAPGTEMCFEVGGSLLKGWNFRTIVQGSSVPPQMIPRLIELWKQGRFPIDKLVETHEFADIDTAFAHSESAPCSSRCSSSEARSD